MLFIDVNVEIDAIARVESCKARSAYSNNKIKQRYDSKASGTRRYSKSVA